MVDDLIKNPERLVVWAAAALGGLLLLLATALGLAVVLEQGWLGPSVRVAGGLTAGVMLWSAGTWLGRRARVLAAVLSGTGMGVLYGTLYASSALYGLVGEGLAFGLMVAVTAVGILSATRQDERVIAHLALVGGMLTPMLVPLGDSHPVGVFAYVLLLVSGALASAGIRRWPELPLTAGVGAVILFVSWTVQWYAGDQILPAFGGLWVWMAPFALTAAWARRKGVLLLEASASLVVVALPLLALPWLALPLVDPVDFLVPAAPWLAALAPALLVTPALVLSRKGRAPIAWAASAVAGLLSLVVAVSWGPLPEAPQEAVVLAAALPILLGVPLLARGGAERHAAALLVLGGGLSLALGVALPGAAPIALFAGIAWITLGGVALAILGPSSATLLATLVATSLPLLGASFAGDVSPMALGGSAALAYGVLVLVPLVGRWRQSPTLPALPWVTAALAGPFLFQPLYTAWIAGLGEAFVALLPLVLGTVSLVGATVLVRRHAVDRRSAELALFIAVGLLGATTAIGLQLETAWLTIALSLQALALAWLSRKLTHPLLRWSAVLLSLAVGVRLLLNPATLAYGEAAGLPVLNWTLWTWGIPAVALLGVGALLRPPSGGETMARIEGVFPHVVRVVGILVGFALVEVQVAHGFQDAGPIELGGGAVLQEMVRSLAWSGYGLVVLLAGVVQRARATRLLGFAFLLLAAAKVFAIDLWALEGFVRVGSVLGLGATLLLAAFLFERVVLAGHMSRRTS